MILCESTGYIIIHPLVILTDFLKRLEQLL